MKHFVTTLSSLKQAKKQRVMITNIPFLVAPIGEHVYLIPDECPHQQASLYQGNLDGDTVTCPLHNASFNLVTGDIDEVSKMIYFDFGPEKITTYKAVIEGDSVYVDI
jgi:3-phenylpropionate/trans-cinnamate dioxygenase ferredoxin component